MAKVKSKRRRRDATMEQALYWKQIYTEIRTEKVLATIRKLMVDQSEDGQREVEPPTFRSLSPRPNGFASASATGRLGYTSSAEQFRPGAGALHWPPRRARSSFQSSTPTLE